MSFDAVSTIHPEYLHIKVTTEYSPDLLFTFLEHIKAEVERTRQRKVLVDSTDFHGSMSEADRFMGGQKIAELFGPRVRLALVMPAGQITKLGEMTAVNRGARFFVTSSEDEAVAYLLRDH